MPANREEGSVVEADLAVLEAAVSAVVGAEPGR